MVRGAVVIGGLLWMVTGVTVAGAQPLDPRSAEGQLRVCGGANWQRIGYLEFEVRIDADQGGSGRWLYQWARREGFLRMKGRSPEGSETDVAVEVTSRTGGGWKSGKQLTGKDLTDTVNWALARFAEDVLWLTFPLEWGAAGVTVRPLEDMVGIDQVKRPAVEVRSPNGSWTCLLDPETGRIHQTLFSRQGVGTYTVIWEDWQPHGGVLFAGRRRIVETGEVIEITVKRALPQTPPAVF